MQAFAIKSQEAAHRLSLFGQGKEFIDLLAQASLQFQPPLAAHRLALGGIRMNLAPIQTDVAQLHDLHGLRELKTPVA